MSYAPQVSPLLGDPKAPTESELRFVFRNISRVEGKGRSWVTGPGRNRHGCPCAWNVEDP